MTGPVRSGGALVGVVDSTPSQLNVSGLVIRQGEGVSTQLASNVLSNNDGLDSRLQLHQREYSADGAERRQLEKHLTRSSEKQFHGKRHESGGPSPEAGLGNRLNRSPMLARNASAPIGLIRALSSLDEALAAGPSNPLSRYESGPAEIFGQILDSDSESDLDIGPASNRLNVGSLHLSSQGTSDSESDSDIGSASIRVNIGSQRFGSQDHRLDDFAELRSTNVREGGHGLTRHVQLDRQPEAGRVASKSDGGKDLYLDSKGRLRESDNASPALKSLLQHTLSRPGQVYQAMHANKDQSQFQLLEKSGRLINWNTSDTATVALHTSKPLTTQGPVLRLSVPESRGKEVVLIAKEGESRHALPDSALRGHLTGIHKDREGSVLRLHERSVFQLKNGSWEERNSAPHAMLGRQPNKHIYAVQEDKKLVDLTKDKTVSTLASKIESYSVDRNGVVGVLSNQEGRDRLTVLTQSGEEGENMQVFDLSAPDGLLTEERWKAKSIISAGDGKWLVSDSEGRAFSAKLPLGEAAKAELQALPQPVLTGAFGSQHRIEGFIANDTGRVYALVKDQEGQVHACPQDDAQNNEEMHFQLGWNMSDKLVIDLRKGLDVPSPDAHQIQDMGRHGRFYLKGDSLHSQDSVTQAWNKVTDKVKGLQQGLNGQAYVLHEGKIKKISLGEASDTIRHGEDNLFSLPYLKRTPALGGVKGFGNAKYEAMAVIDSNRYVGVEPSGRMVLHQVRPGTDRDLRPLQLVTQSGLDGKAIQLSIDKAHTLYALSEKHTLFKLDSSAWLLTPDKRQEASWQPLSLPSGESSVQLGLSSDQKLAVTRDQQVFKLNDEQWIPDSTTRPDYSKETLYDTLKRSDHNYKKINSGPLKGMTVAKESNYADMNNQESRLKSRFRDRFQAHIFKFSMETPRPLKVLGDRVQHVWQGREGLAKVYQAEKDIFRALKELSGAPLLTAPLLTRAEHPLSMSSRINMVEREVSGDMSLALNALYAGETGLSESARPTSMGASALDLLDLGDSGRTLVDVMRNLRDEIAFSAEHQVRILAGAHGLHAHGLQSSGQTDAQRSSSEPQSTARSRDDLIGRLLPVWKGTVDTSERKTLSFLEAFERNKVAVSLPNSDVALGRQRDTFDKLALSKARLSLDTLALKKLDDLVKRAESLPIDPGQSPLKALAMEVYQLKESFYGDNPVKQYTDMGYAHHREMENDYEAIKFFLKALKKEDHGVSVTSRTVFGTDSQQEMLERMAIAIGQLEPDETISVTRSYGGSASAGLRLEGFGGLTVQVGADQGLKMNFGRSTDNNLVSVSFEKEQTGKLGGTVYTGIDLTEVGHELANVRVGGGVSVNAKGSSINSITFKLSNEQTADFLRDLGAGKITVEDVMQRSHAHMKKSGTKWSVDVDTNVAVMLRTKSPAIDKGGKGALVSRASLGVGVSVNLFSVSGGKGKRENYNEVKKEQVAEHRPRFFNKASFEAHLKPDGATSHLLKSDVPVTESKSGDLVLQFRAPATFSKSIVMTDTIKKNARVEMKMAASASSSDLSKVNNSLKSHFSDKTSQTVMAEVAKLKDIKEKLHILNTHFTQMDPEVLSEDQFKAVQSLQNLKLRHDSAEKKALFIFEASFDVQYSNPDRLNRAGWVSGLLATISPDKQPPLAERFNAFMEKDPKLRGLVKALQESPSCTAIVEMEMTDEAKLQAGRAFLDETLTVDGFSKLLSKESNRHIGSITVMESRSKVEGMSVPLLFGKTNSSAAINMTTRLGEIRFSYGKDQMVPTGYKLEGRIAEASDGLTEALRTAKQTGQSINGI